MRVKSGRFPTIEKDLKMVLAHCGSLFLDPAALAEVSSPSISIFVSSCCLDVRGPCTDVYDGS